MKLTIFGAGGAIGRRLTAQALAAGHDVTAFVREPSRLGQAHPRLRVMRGDVLDAAAVERAVLGRDAVLCALGAPLLNRDGVRLRGTRVIVRAMERAGVDRLICLSMLGVGELRIQKDGEVEFFAIAGGFVQVRPDKVVVMAELADLAAEIDLEAAQEARNEAERAIAAGFDEPADLAQARAAMERALLRIRVAERRHREGPRQRR